MSKQAGPSLIQVPKLFSVVEPGVYRCASPTAYQVPFLASLNLKTVISLTPEHPIKAFVQFTRSSGIDFLHLGTTLWGPLTDWKPIRDEVVKTTLEIMLDARNHPLLIVDPLGIHQLGCVIGALRMMQGWNFASALVEYRSHSGPLKHRYADEQYIELFDPDLVNIPRAEYLPDWFDLPDLEEQTDYEEEEPAVQREVDGTPSGQEVVKEGKTAEIDGLNNSSPQGNPVGVG